MFAEITGRRESWLSVTNATPRFTELFLFKRGWWVEVHCTPLSDFVHCRLLLKCACLCSLPAFFKQLKQTWFSLAPFIRSSTLIATNFWHWSGQWVESRHNQHLCLFLFPLSISVRRWLTGWFIAGGLSNSSTHARLLVYILVAGLWTRLFGHQRTASALSLTTCGCCPCRSECQLPSECCSIAWPNERDRKNAHLPLDVALWIWRCPV